MTASLGYRTDLMLLTLQGSSIAERDDHLIVRTPDNPTHHRGNFLLLAQPPEPGTAASWRDAFEREFPNATHLALGVDGTRGETGDEDELTAANLHAERNTVLTAEAAYPPPRPSRDAEFRMLGGDDDWRAALALKEAGNVRFEPAEYHDFARRKLATLRRLQERGLGAWFGAFSDGRLVSALGVFSDGAGTARFQSVDTHPAYRRRGLAGTLVHTASDYALTRLGARKLVIVADPAYTAIRVYRSVGFTDTETQVHLSTNNAYPSGYSW
jgi:ribosomal protein S18 acetylase RimI-like enzyme